jgi:hypothetical protein
MSNKAGLQGTAVPWRGMGPCIRGMHEWDWPDWSTPHAERT